VVEDLEVMSDAELHHFCVESDYTVNQLIAYVWIC
jgi:hypothetical protein